jgi:hypothetical protein
MVTDIADQTFVFILEHLSFDAVPVIKFPI